MEQKRRTKQSSTPGRGRPSQARRDQRPDGKARRMPSMKQTIPNPSNPQAVEVTYNRIKVEWDKDAGAEEKKLYTLEWSFLHKKWHTAYMGYGRTETFESLFPSTVYHFRVKCRDGTVESGWSDVVDIATQKEPPSLHSLVAAIEGEDLERVNSILEEDKDKLLKLNTPIKFGRTALMLATIRNCNSIVRALIDHGADVCNTDESGRNCLMIACYSGNVEVTKLMLKLGCTWNESDKIGNTPLHCAVEGDKSDIVEMAINGGADPHAVDVYGWTPLLKHAVIGGSREITQLLIKAGANIDAQDSYGNTALMLATIKNHADIAKELMENNCDWTVQTKYGRNALDMAQGLDRFVILQLLNKARDVKRRADRQLRKQYSEKAAEEDKQAKEAMEKGAAAPSLADQKPLYILPDLEESDSIVNVMKKH